MALIVNGEKVSPGEIDNEVERLRPHYEEYAAGAEGAGEEQLREWARENVIERTLMMQAARQAPAEVPQADIDAAYGQIKDRAGDDDPAAVKADIEQQIRLERLMDEAAKDVKPPTDKEQGEFYEQHPEHFTMPEQVRASHIVKYVGDQVDRKTAFEAILELKMELDRSAGFEELATKHSDCPENAGDLGYFARGQMVQEFEDVAFGMKAGQVSDIFQTSYGYHICKLVDRKAETLVPFEEVTDDIEEEILRQRRDKAIEDFVDSLKAEATIEEVAD
ncbi:MAG: peptidylprolyl isomerase [Phycisphaerae bacterium]|nr:peptidylprolyl isomerase [Phycisphaerae bacterium]